MFLPVRTTHLSHVCLRKYCTCTHTQTHTILLRAFRLFLHHYEDYMERAGFDEALETIAALTSDYREADKARAEPVVRLRARGMSLA